MKTTFPIPSEEHEEIIREMARIIEKHFSQKIAFIILFGSFARGDWVYDYSMEEGTAREYASDYDLLILTKTGKLGTSVMGMDLENGIKRKLSSFYEVNRKHGIVR